RHAARVEAEQLIVAAARAATEARPPAAAAGRGERAHLYAVDDDVEGLIGIELLRDDIELPVLIGPQDELRAPARILIRVGGGEGLLPRMARSCGYGHEPEGEGRDARGQGASGKVLSSCGHGFLLEVDRRTRGRATSVPDARCLLTRTLRPRG